jgi:hypothetical protein
VPLFGSKDDDPPCRLQVLTLDHVIEGSADISGQNLIRLIYLTDVTMRPASGSTPPAPRGSTWAIGEDMSAVIGLVPLDEKANQELYERGNPGKHELRADVYTGPYVVRGTLLAIDDDPKVITQVRSMVCLNAEIECLAPGSTLGSWSAPLILLFMNQLQGMVLAD